MWMPYLNEMDLIRNGFTHHREITDWANAAGPARQTLGRANPGLTICFRKWIATLSCLPIRIYRDAPTAEALRFSMFDALTGLSRNPGRKGQRHWEHWLAQNRTNNIVAIDIGSGFNTPMWVRWPLEQITTLQPGNTLIRLNRDHPDVPAQIKAQSICFQEDPLDILTKLIQHPN